MTGNFCAPLVVNSDLESKDEISACQFFFLKKDRHPHLNSVCMWYIQVHAGRHSGDPKKSVATLASWAYLSRAMGHVEWWSLTTYKTYTHIERRKVYWDYIYFSSSVCMQMQVECIHREWARCTETILIPRHVLHSCGFTSQLAVPPSDPLNMAAWGAISWWCFYL